MLSEKARKQLQMFLNTLEKETGYKADHVWLSAFEGTQETVNSLEKQGMELVNFNNNQWGEFHQVEDNLKIQISYHYTPEEAEPETCHRCQAELTAENTCSHLMDETCLQCYDELAAEKRQQLTEYRNSVI